MSDGLIRCPALRGLIHDGKLPHEELTTASVAHLMQALSGKPDALAPNEPGSLANVAGFFAIFNHGLPRDVHAAAVVAAGGTPSHSFDLRLFESPGDHPGTVNFFSNDSNGKFEADHFASVMAEVSDGETLTIQGIAKMIVAANKGNRDRKGTTLDLVKSAGEWALMVCALRDGPATTDISVAELKRLYSEKNSEKLCLGSRRATALDWLEVTVRITAAIAAQKRGAILRLARELHSAFKDLGTLCPCVTCNPGRWTAFLRPRRPSAGAQPAP